MRTSARTMAVRRGGGEEDGGMPSGLEPEELIRRTAELFGVLSDPTRIKIVHALSRADLCVGDLARLAGVSDSAVSHQLRVLRNLGLVSYRREGKLAVYSLSDEHLERILEQSLDHVREKS